MSGYPPEFRRRLSKDYHKVLDVGQALGFEARWLNTDRTAVVLEHGEHQVRIPTGKGFQTDTPDLLVRRLQRMTGGTEDEDRGLQSRDEPDLFQCPTCHAEFESEGARDAHVRQHEEFEANVGQVETVPSWPNGVPKQFLADVHEVARAWSRNTRGLLAVRYDVQPHQVGKWLADLRQAGFTVPDLPKAKAGGPPPQGWEPIPQGWRISGAMWVKPEAEFIPADEPLELPEEEPERDESGPDIGAITEMFAQMVAAEIRRAVADVTRERDEARAEADRYRSKWEALAALITEENA
jgi:hypothetical protein